ncbi:hypothetical protein [Clostridioides sp. ES-S-0001-03]|uniref:hypothetical protein n=1 Tax=Clostridioides sp. ES-S-0001-03 TaxID=2770771 RepID=UPI001D0C832E|nr:hypothetical protein [Clostridioides sp. ES-S-0001-03]
MIKKRKLKKKAAILIGVVVFFIIYFISFKIGLNMEKDKSEVPKKVETETEDNRSLMTQIKEKKKIYVSDKNVENIKIEEDMWNEIKFFFSEFKKVRNTTSYEAIYEGYSDDGIKFSTDLNFFRVYTVNKEEYYKVPIDSKNSFKKLLDESIYTSFDLLSHYKDWKEVTITYGKETKKVHKWKFDDLAHKMISKRVVGKVQPEKSKERSDYNFSINIKGENFAVKVDTMGKDYVKVTSKKTVSYYEVHTSLFDYLKNEIFEIGKK